MGTVHLSIAQASYVSLMIFFKEYLSTLLREIFLALEGTGNHNLVSARYANKQQKNAAHVAAMVDCRFTNLEL